VAAGLAMTAFHTANEAGWLTIGQAPAFDLSWLVRPGTPLSSLLTGVLGIQPYPVWIEVIAWLAYLVPMAVIVAWPRRPGAKQAAPPGLVAQQDGVTVTVFAFDIADDRIRHIWAIRNPEKLQPWKR
jgi:high-affinity iron transporter